MAADAHCVDCCVVNAVACDNELTSVRWPTVECTDICCQWTAFDAVWPADEWVALQPRQKSRASEVTVVERWWSVNDCLLGYFLKYHVHKSTVFYMWNLRLLCIELHMWSAFEIVFVLDYFFLHDGSKPVYTLCPNKSDPLADFLIACNKVYRIKHNFMNTYQYVLQIIMQSFWKIRLRVTQKSNCEQNRINIWLYNYSIATCSQSYNDNV